MVGLLNAAYPEYKEYHFTGVDVCLFAKPDSQPRFPPGNGKSLFRFGKRLFLLWEKKPYLFCSMVIPVLLGCFSALAFLTAIVLSTHSSAVFRSAARAAGSSHCKSARSRYNRFIYAM